MVITVLRTYENREIQKINRSGGVWSGGEIDSGEKVGEEVDRWANA
jgi:hypothetical protein